jgi:hypothetical protein
MASTIRIAPPYSLIFISDLDGGTSPECIGGKSLWATPSCIAVGCLMFQDGETEVTLGPVREVDPGGSPVFDGMLETPNKSVIVSTAEHETLLDVRVPNTSTRVRIWSNHPTEPDKVVVGLG